jgi:septum formation protein
MSTFHSRIYLASQSPRYRDSLKQIGVSFELLLLRIDPRRQIAKDEAPHTSEATSDYLERSCCTKAIAGRNAWISRGLRPFPVLAADSVIELDGTLIGKPRDQKESADILRKLSGRQHQLTSAVAVAFQDRVVFRLTKTVVTFATLNEERINFYVIGNEGRDRVGAYAVEGLGGAFIKRIEGSHSALFGLPLFETVELLADVARPI